MKTSVLECRVTGLLPFSSPSSLSTQKLAPNNQLQFCTGHHGKCVIPTFYVSWHFRKISHLRLPRSEEDLEKVTLQSEISTWWVLTFVTLYEKKICGL